MLKLGCLFKNFHWSVCIAKIHKSKSQWRFWTSVLISCTLSTQLVWIKIKIEEIYHIASHAHQILFLECASIHRKIYVCPESSCGGAVSVWRLCSDKAGVMTRCVPSVSWIQPFVRAGSEMVSRYTATTAHCTLGHWLVTIKPAVSKKNLTPEGGALRMCKTTTFTTIFQYNSRQLCIAQPHFTCMSCTWSIDC